MVGPRQFKMSQKGGEEKALAKTSQAEKKERRKSARKLRKKLKKVEEKCNKIDSHLGNSLKKEKLNKKKKTLICHSCTQEWRAPRRGDADWPTQEDRGTAAPGRTRHGKGGEKMKMKKKRSREDNFIYTYIRRKEMDEFVFIFLHIGLLFFFLSFLSLSLSLSL